MFQPALNKSGKIVLATQETPRDEHYTCVSCQETMILRKGNIIRPHFAHKMNTNCSAESAIHKAGKLLLQEFLLTGQELTIRKQCRRYCCQETHYLQLNENVLVYEEKAFLYRGKRIVPDVSITTKEGTLLVALEVYHTHRQKGRPEPWYEFRALDILHAFSTGETFLLDYRQNLPCTKPKRKRTKRRTYYCGECGQNNNKQRYLNCRHYSCRACYRAKPDDFPCPYCAKPIKPKIKVDNTGTDFAHSNTI